MTIIVINFLFINSPEKLKFKEKHLISSGTYLKQIQLLFKVHKFTKYCSIKKVLFDYRDYQIMCSIYFSITIDLIELNTIKSHIDTSNLFIQIVGKVKQMNKKNKYPSTLSKMQHLIWIIGSNLNYKLKILFLI